MSLLDEEEDSHTQQERESINNDYEGKENNNKRFQFGNEEEEEIKSKKCLSESNIDEEKEFRVGMNKNKNKNIRNKSQDSYTQKENKLGEEEIQEKDKDDSSEIEDNENLEENGQKSQYIEEDNYIVERILKKRINNKKSEYLVKWQGFPNSKNTWESLSNLENIKDMIYQFEYHLPQTGKQPKVTTKVLQNLCPTKIERIFGHDKIGKKSQYLVAYTGIPKPIWVNKHDLPMSYYRQYQQSLTSKNSTCIIEQIKQSKENQDSKIKASNKIDKKNKQQENQIEKDTSMNKKKIEDLFSSMDEEENEIQLVQPKRKYTKKKKIIPDQDSKDNSSIYSLKTNLKRKNVLSDKCFTQDSHNDSIQFFASQHDDSILTDKSKKKLKSSEFQPTQLDNSKNNQIESNDKQIDSKELKINKKAQVNYEQENEVTYILDQEQINDIIEVKRESSVNNDQLRQDNNELIDLKEGSFENNDKIQRVIIRSSEKELEAMIFEVFWKPRNDHLYPKSKLVRYGELKKYSPESLIYWLEVMVKNSVKELENDDLIMKDLKEQIKILQDKCSILQTQLNSRPLVATPPPPSHLGGINNQLIIPPKINQLQFQLNDIQQSEIANNGEDLNQSQRLFLQKQYQIQAKEIMQNKQQIPLAQQFMLNHQNQNFLNGQNGMQQPILFSTSNFIPPLMQNSLEQLPKGNKYQKQGTQLKKEDVDHLNQKKKRKGRPKKDESAIKFSDYAISQQ